MQRLDAARISTPLRSSGARRCRRRDRSSSSGFAIFSLLITVPEHRYQGDRARAEWSRDLPSRARAERYLDAFVLEAEQVGIPVALGSRPGKQRSIASRWRSASSTTRPAPGRGGGCESGRARGDSRCLEGVIPSLFATCGSRRKPNGKDILMVHGHRLRRWAPRRIQQVAREPRRQSVAQAASSTSDPGGVPARPPRSRAHRDRGPRSFAGHAREPRGAERARTRSSGCAASTSTGSSASWRWADAESPGPEAPKKSSDLRALGRVRVAARSRPRSTTRRRGSGLRGARRLLRLRALEPARGRRARRPRLRHRFTQRPPRASAAGAEVLFGDGADRRRSRRGGTLHHLVPDLTRSRLMSAALRDGDPARRRAAHRRDPAARPRPTRRASSAVPLARRAAG